MSRNWSHLVRFLAKEDGQIHLGQINAGDWPDVGLALEKGSVVKANLVQGSVFDGTVTDTTMTIEQVRGPNFEDGISQDALGDKRLVNATSGQSFSRP